MASNHHYLFFAILFAFISFTNSHTPFLSYDVLRAGRSSGRSLLEGENNCPIDMESKNYTIITSKCKGPEYPASFCCEALLEFCCGFADELNDLTNNCAGTMFDYIDMHGKYPTGLFFNKCQEGPEGLSCDKALEAQAHEAKIKSLYVN